MTVVSPEEGVQIKPAPAPRAVTPQFPQINSPTRTSRRRRKLWRFILLEAVAFIALLISAELGISDGLVQAKLTAPFQIAVICSAIALALIPVAFFGIPGRRYRRRRYR